MLQYLSLITLLIGLTGCGSSLSESDSPAQQSNESISWITYKCESGTFIRASYPSDSTAIAEYESRTLQMTIAISASGARYVDNEYVWWTKGSGPGSEGTLYRRENSKATGEILEQCEQKQ